MDDAEISQLWPEDLGRMGPNQPEQLPSMPASIDELDAWAYIGNVDDSMPNRGKQLFYRAVVGERVPVKLILSGVVRRVSVAPLGTWSG